MAFIGVKDSSKPMAQSSNVQGIGEYCKGRDIEDCRKYFGKEILKRVCITCPQ